MLKEQWGQVPSPTKERLRGNKPTYVIFSLHHRGEVLMIQKFEIK